MKRYLSLLIVPVLFSVFSCKQEKEENKSVVFMDNFKVFDQFEMKKDYDKLIETSLMIEQNEIDSLSVKLEKPDAQDKADLTETLRLKQEAFQIKFSELSKKYTAEVYARLNTYIKDYGKQKKYSIVLGANGQGGVMYVDDKVDITNDLIKYINKEYAK